MEWQVLVNNNSFERAGITKDCKDAICEYIWNGFEAGANKIVVKQNGSLLTEAISIEVIDNGSGIVYDNLSSTFGAFLSSIKNDSNIRIKSQSNKGKGRFSYLCFSPSAEWKTTFEQDGILKTYKIRTNTSDKSHFETTDYIVDKNIKNTGTSVEFPIMEPDTLSKLSFDEMECKLLEEFAWFLYLNKSKNFSIEYMGNELDVTQYINTELSKTITESLDGEVFEINIIVWYNNIANSSKIFYLADAGEIVHVENTSYNKNTVNFYHAVFVKSTYFNTDMFFPQDDDSELLLETQDNQQNILRQLKKKIKLLLANTLRAFLILQADQYLAGMEERNTLPFFSKDPYDELRKKDLKNVAKELYCIEPRIFYKLNVPQEKSLMGFLNLLLSSEERESVLQIVEQVVNLTPEQRKSFAEILQRTNLQYIVDAIGIIEKRIYIIEQLKKIVYDMTSFANERDHIQKIVEQHFWLFGEQYHLLTADKNMKTTLQEFEVITDNKDNTRNIALTPDEALQRIDIFLYTQRLQEDRSSEMLIIELKAPSIKLNLEVYNQIVRYAYTIRKEPRFNSPNRTWRFFAICSSIEEEVKIKYNNFKQHGRKGLVDIIENFEIYALSWDDIFQAFESRHSFLLERLKIDYSNLLSDFGSDEDGELSRDRVNDLRDRLIALKA